MSRSLGAAAAIVTVVVIAACSGSDSAAPESTVKDAGTPATTPTGTLDSGAPPTNDGGTASDAAVNGDGGGDDDDDVGTFTGGDPAAEAAVRAVRIVPPGALANPVKNITLPASMTLTDLPPVVAQGTAAQPGEPGSCEAQSYGYALGTYTAAHDENGTLLFSPTTDANRISAAWLYNFVLTKEGKACPDGTAATDYLDHLVRAGSPSYADQAYQPTCAFLGGLDTSGAPPADAAKFTIGSYAVHPLSTVTSTFVKAQIAAGHVVAFTGPVCKGYGGNVPLDNGVFTCPTGIIQGSGHGQAIVGYDDTKGTAGAFLVQNSFGTDWPSAGAGGRIWFAYDALMSTQDAVGVAFPVRATVAGVALTATTVAAPAGTVARSWQFTNTTDAWLLADFHFADWVSINTVTLTSPSGKVATGNYGQSIRDGYAYFYRTDGNSFTPGDYQLSAAATLKDGTAATYAATVTVAAGAPATLPAADFPATGLEDSTLLPATVH